MPCVTMPDDDRHDMAHADADRHHDDAFTPGTDIAYDVYAVLRYSSFDAFRYATSFFAF